MIEKKLWEALLDGRICIATDHAPTTLKEKQQPYLKAPSDGPLAYLPLCSMFGSASSGKVVLKIVEEECAIIQLKFFKMKNVDSLKRVILI
jgi:dihydroorotase